MAPEVSEKEGSYASRFYCWFLESFKSCLLLLMALPSLSDTLAQLLARRSLLWLTMMWRQRFLTQSNFLSTTSLACISGSTSIVLFNQEKPLRWTEINTHTHTHTHTSSNYKQYLNHFGEKTQLMYLPDINEFPPEQEISCFQFNWFFHFSI